ncbi:hypothetical protein [Deinococcus misasensis]|uniref:hypothetical protein n=1 Tax=Deinococcus misasensis TaxID=392413 RepID=UPI0012F8334A|nr:hypothetical protein [Deinococcus misasensis]
MQNLLDRLVPLSMAIEEGYCHLILEAVKSTDDTLEMTLWITSQEDHLPTVDEKWSILAEGVVDHHLYLGICEDISTLEEQHPRIDLLSSDWKDLYIASNIEDVPKFLGDWLLAHNEQKFGPFGHFGPYSLQATGARLFASGPQELMQDYFDVAEQHGLRPTLLPGYNPRAYQTKGKRLLLLNFSGEESWQMRSFVVATSFQAALKI